MVHPVRALSFSGVTEGQATAACGSDRGSGRAALKWTVPVHRVLNDAVHGVDQPLSRLVVTGSSGGGLWLRSLSPS
jgi:hypothetical protein